MTDTTIGQRIARERKRLGLSQEALGEKLGVSRQAISKWESDAAIPEIDKLIVLSKLFGVSVGWLLGTEAEPNPAASESRGFTDEQLRMVEEIVKRYSQPAAAPRKHSRWGKALMAGAVILALILSIKAVKDADQGIPDYSGQISSLSSNFNSIQYQLQQLDQRLEELSEMEKLLESEMEKLLENDWSFAAIAWDDWNGATVTFSAVPKAWQEGDKAYLVVRREGLLVKQALCQWDGTGCSAAVELSAEDGYEYYYMVSHADGSQEQQTLATAGYGEYWAPIDLKTALSYHCDSSLFTWKQTRGTLELGMLKCILSAPELAGKYGFPETKWESVDLILMLNGKEVLRQKLVWRDPEKGLMVDHATGTWQDKQWDYGYVDFECHGVTLELPEMEEGDVLILTVVAVTSDGREVRDQVAGWTETAGELEETAKTVEY